MTDLIPSVSVRVSSTQYKDIQGRFHDEYWVSFGVTTKDHELANKQFEYHHFYSLKRVWQYIYETLNDWTKYRLYDRYDELEDQIVYRHPPYDCREHGCRY